MFTKIVNSVNADSAKSAATMPTNSMNNKKGGYGTTGDEPDGTFWQRLTGQK